MADDTGGGGFGWGLVIGLAVGIAVGALLATGSGRAQLDALKERTVELTGAARRVTGDPQSPLRQAVTQGVAAARHRHRELGGWVAPATGEEPAGG